MEYGDVKAAYYAMERRGHRDICQVSLVQSKSASPKPRNTASPQAVAYFLLRSPTGLSSGG